MITFLIGIAILILGYFIWGKIAEKIFEPDTRLTPAYNHPDTVERVPLSNRRNMFLHLLNIAGLGPIMGVALGIKFGPIVFLLLPIGNVIGGAIHDFFIGMISMRNNGADLSTLTRKFIGNKMGLIFSGILIFALILVIATFTNLSGTIISGITNELFGINGIWVFILAVILCLVYYIISTLFPIDRIIGKFYPYVGGLLIAVTIAVIIFMIPNMNQIPNVPFSLDGFLSAFSQHQNGQPIIPMLFVTIACGILSGFHATQSPIVAKTIQHEKNGRKIFYGMMICEGLLAMIWAGAFSLFYMQNPEFLSLSNGAEITITAMIFLFPVVLAVFSLLVFVLLGITSCDTSLRVIRTTIAEIFHIDQKRFIKRVLVILLPLVAIIVVIVWANLDPNRYGNLWNYFSWFNQIIASIALSISTIYLACKGKKWIITAIPGCFIMFICFTYILWISPEHITGTVVGFGMPLIPACIIGGILSVVTITMCVLHGFHLRKQKEFLPDEKPRYPAP